MPVSRQNRNKPTIRKRSPKRPPTVNFGPDGVSVSPRAFNQFRNSHDFEVLVRVGRIVNALGFALDTQRATADLSKAEQVRRSTRGLFLMSAYLWEGLLVLHNLVEDDSDKYQSCAGFARLAAVSKRGSYGKHKAIVRAIRNNVGFHLDHEVTATKDQILKIEQVADYDILSMNAERRFFYVDISDEIDIRHITNIFRGARRSQAGTLIELIDLVTQLAVEIMVGANEFVMNLLVRLQLIPDEQSILLRETLPSRPDDLADR